MNIHEHYKILEFEEHGDERGNLVIVEGNRSEEHTSELQSH